MERFSKVIWGYKAKEIINRKKNLWKDFDKEYRRLNNELQIALEENERLKKVINDINEDNENKKDN